MSKNYTCSIYSVNATLSDIKQNIIQNYPNTSIKLSPSVYKSGTSTKPPINIYIGTKSLHDNLQNNFVRDQDFVLTVLSLFHEEQHVKRRLQFQESNVPDDVKQIARIDLISTTMPEYYRHQSGYFDNIGEIDAELHGILETRAFFKTNFPEIDVDTELTHIIQESYQWYASKRFHTIDETIQNLETAKQESYHKYIPLPIKIAIPSKKSPALKIFMKSQERIDTYWNFRDGMQANQFLLDFIAEEQPWRFYRYPCIRSEWPESALNGTAKPPTLASIRHLDRGSEAESRFEDILSHANSPDNSFSY